MRTYKVHQGDVRYVETRQGIAAYASVRDDKGIIVATIDDQPEKIVASVTILDPTVTPDFIRLGNKIDVVKEHGHNSDSFAMSEYVRSLISETEEVTLHG